ncbi:MAG: alkaline phosphatase family protein [Myxococcota bacterium]|nr:alkaline phosphatase family protein [Myxococcota bacterium]
MRFAALRLLAPLLALAGALGCALACGAPGRAAAREPSVVMISLDGTRPADARGLPVFERIAREGALAERLVPARPSNTFPNHVTLVTGVAPDRHGIVNNSFSDPERGRYRYEADPTWIEVEPLWSLLAGAGLASASFHWVGSEGAWRSGRGPREYRRFDASVPAHDKLEQVLAWLEAPDPPRLITCWLPGADRAAHRHGPGAPEAVRALARQAEALAVLVERLEARGLRPSTTLLLVSDHGMEAVTRTVDLGRALDAAGGGAEVLGGGGFATVWLRSPTLSVEAVVEVARGLGLEAWARARAPAAWRLSHPRFGDVVVQAPPGTGIVRHDDGALVRDAAAGPLELRGSHGYAPERPGMAALFAAWGRGVAPGGRPGTVRAVDVAPTVLALLGVPVPSWMEGRPIELGGE